MQLTRAALGAVAAAAAVQGCGVPPISLPRSPARMFARADAKLFTLEMAPGETIQVTEEEKFELMNRHVRFFDITEFPDAPNAMLSQARLMAAVPYPANLTQQLNVSSLAAKLDKNNIKANLERFSSFHNRHYQSQYGIESTEWLYGQIKAVIDQSNSPHVSIRYVRHTAFGQPSIIVTIAGFSERTVVAGSHLDSIVSANPQGLAPGADDNGSSSTMLIEVLRILLSDPRIAAGELRNTLEFHWYAAEEAGLLGSQDVFRQYNASGRFVQAMLNQDMVGYIGRDGRERFGVVTDFTDPDLVRYLKTLIDGYTSIPWEDTVCNYACSDHASATRSGFPSAFIFETAFGNHNPYIHTVNDTVDKISYDHIIQHARLTLGFLYELAFWTWGIEAP